MDCRLCNNNNVELLLDFGDQPIVHHLLKNQNDSYDVFPFKLGVCNSCGFLQLMECISPTILYDNYFTILLDFLNF